MTATTERDGDTLTPEERAVIAEVVDDFPPLGPAIVTQLRTILRGGR